MAEFARGLCSPGSLESAPVPTQRSLSDLVVPGRLVELSGSGNSARTSTAVSLLRYAQQRGETSAWIQSRNGSLFPPDLADCGVDLDALIVVHIPALAGPHAKIRAAEILLRSTAYGLIVLDLSKDIPPGSPSAWQGRLLGLARQHTSRILILTRSTQHESSLGPLIALRVDSRRHEERSPTGSTSFRIDHEILKNKSSIPIDPVAHYGLAPWMNSQEPQ